MTQASPEGGISGQAQTVPCGKCGRAIDPTTAVYSKQGELLCKSCENNDIVIEGYLRAAGGLAMGALSAGLLGYVFNPFAILSISAVILGGRALILLSTEEYKTALQNKRGPLMAAAIIGLLAGAVPLVFIARSFMG